MNSYTAVISPTRPFEIGPLEETPLWLRLLGKPNFRCKICRPAADGKAVVVWKYSRLK